MLCLGLGIDTNTRAVGEGGVSAFTDDFNRADENLEVSDNWTRVGGVTGLARVANNELYLTAISTNQAAYLCPDQGTADNYVEFTARNITSSASPFVATRLTDSSNFVGIRYNPASTRWETYKRVAGTFTLIASIFSPPTFAVGDTIKLEVFGNILFMYINGYLRTSDYIGTDAALQGVTRQGIVARTISHEPFIDNFTAGATVFATGPFADNFNRANENLEASANWLWDGRETGAVQVSANRLLTTSTTTVGTTYRSPNLGSADHYVQYEVANTTDVNASYVCCRLGDTSNFVGIRNTQGTVVVARESDALGSVVLYSGTPGISVGSVLRLECIGTNWEAFLNGVSFASGAIGDDSLGSPRQGLYAQTNAINPWIDNYEAGVI